MEHLVYSSCMVIVGILYLMTLGYARFQESFSDLYLVGPTLLMTITLIYVMIYNTHTHSKLIMMAYIFKFLENFIYLASVSIKDIKIVFMYVQILLYISSRVMFLLNHIMYPYKTHNNIVRIHINYFGRILIFVIICAVSIFYMNNALSHDNYSEYIYLIPVFVTISVLSIIYAGLRIIVYKWESKFAVMCCFMAESLFCISDSTYGYSLFVQNIKGIENITTVLSNIGLWLISLSLIRQWRSFDNEKAGTYNYGLNTVYEI